MEQKKDIIKKLELVGQLSKIISCVATTLIVVIYSCGSSDDSARQVNSNSKKLIGVEELSDTSEFFIATYNLDTSDYYSLGKVLIENLFIVLKNVKIKKCPTQIDLFKQYISEDSVCEVYKIQLCENALVCENVFQGDDFSRQVYLNTKRLSKQSILTKTKLEPDSMNLQINYSFSNYYQITAEEKSFLLIVSKSEQWTGEMSNFNFIQLIDMKSLACKEFVETLL